MQLDGENGVLVPGLGLFWLEGQVRSIPRPIFDRLSAQVASGLETKLCSQKAKM